MAEAFYQILITKAISLIEGEIGLLRGVDKEMKKLANTLTTIQKVLEDAEDKQFQSRAIQNWLRKLNEIAYDIEDVLDECVTQVSNQKKHQCITRCGSIKNILHHHKIGRRIKDVAEKLDALAADRHNFSLSETVVNGDWRRETGSVVKEPDHVYGRDEDIDRIVDVLLNQVSNCDHLSVLPIIGVGGLGKTTLAQLVYNDERVVHHFHTRLWVSVSDRFDQKILLEAMIESATGSAPNIKHLHALQCLCQQVLNNKRYLLILDDVWNENQEAWLELKSTLACGAKGSSVVVTTRMQKVGDIMGTLPAYSLTELSEEHCWLLFKLRAFGEEEQHQHLNLENIGREIVKKCGGVPLAAKALGGLLRFKREEGDWIRVKDSKIWNLPEEENSILPVLRLSYRHLPILLKRCFAYCAVFPKGGWMDKQELILCWMAHGCISSTETQEVEDVGDQVCNELVLRSLFQEDDTFDSQTFILHDLVYDLARFIWENKIPGAETNTSASDSKILEVYWKQEDYDFHTSSSSSITLSPLTTIMNYKRLRILRLCGADVKYLPSEIGKLKRLRIFDASFSSIESLPRTFCDLVNLQTLVLIYCLNLNSLPKHIRRMTNLRHIFLDGCSSLSHMPSRISQLTSLKTLSLFIVGEKLGSRLDELEHLNLGGTLEIKHLERFVNDTNPNLVGKPKLDSLVLEWEDEGRSMDDEEVLEALEPHVNLKTLVIRGFRGRLFPPWIIKMENLVEIFIERCPSCSYLPDSLGRLPSLQFLIIQDADALEYLSENRSQNSAFPSLETLELCSLRNLKGLLKNEVGEMMFPNLQTLEISECPLLEMPSVSLSALEDLRVKDCSQLTLSSFSQCKLDNLSSLSLEFDEINDCSWSIPQEISSGLYNVKGLEIKNAWQQHLPMKFFQGLLSVTSLSLSSCKIGSCFPYGWLCNLTTLDSLDIESCSELGELEDYHLLKRLTLQTIDEMVSLPQGLQNIHTLQVLKLRNLTNLNSLPDWLANLTSLSYFQISHCPQLPSLPSTIKGMTNLGFLIIDGCPQLEVRCEKEKGLDWHIIAHVPGLFIGTSLAEEVLERFEDFVSYPMQT